MASKKERREKRRAQFESLRNPVEKSVEDSAERPPDLKWGKKTWLTIGLIVLITAAVFFPSLKNGFTNWDDRWYVTQSTLIQGLSADYQKAIWTTPVRSNYHPITILSLALNYKFFQLNPMAYHATDLILHLFNTLLVFCFIFWLSRGNLFAAALTALFFGIHPMHVESVAWVSARKDVLYTFFFMLSLISYLRFVDRGRESGYIMSLILFIPAVLSKPSAVVLPLVLFLIDVFRKRKINWRLGLEKVPFFMIAVAIGLVTIKYQAEVAISSNFDFVERTLLASYGFTMYIVKLFVPIKLSTFYPYPDRTGGLPGYFYLFPVFVFGIFTLAAVWWKRTRVVAFGVLFYAVNLALVLQFVGVGGAIMADRYTYVPYIGVFFILGMAGSVLLGKLQDKPLWLKALPVAVPLVYALVFAGLTLRRIPVWKDSETLWTDVINNYPNVPYAYNNRGIYYHYRQSRYEEALSDYNHALKYKPDYTDGLKNRADLCTRFLKKPEIALADYTRLIAKFPNRDLYYYLRGKLLGETMKKYDEGLADLDRAIELNPANDGARNSRGRLYFNIKKDYAKAMIDFEQAIQTNPRNGLFYLNRSRCHYMMQDKVKARADMEKARSLGTPINPTYEKALNL